MISVSELGWNEFFEAEFRKIADEGLRPARVVEELKDAWRVQSESGELLGEIAGKLRLEQSSERWPAVGDWVAIAPRGGDARATIRVVLPRRSKVSRKVAGRAAEEQVIAANLDTIFVVSSLNRDLNPRRIERYLAMVWESGASPAVLLTKSDVCDDAARFAAEIESVAIGVPVHVLSAVSGEGLAVLNNYLRPGRTVALVGSSGVGKSTLINRLLGRNELATKPIREDDDRGRHATTSRRLVLLPGGGMLIDTPGMRELQLWDADAGLDRAFEDIAARAAECRFRDCTHRAEPGCAVRQAIESGDLDAERLENFRKLERELAFLARKQDAGLQSAEEKKWRKIHQEQKRVYQSRERHGRQ
ncbi:MAG TPA: ribosome small subunit-dependent GTPase A [Candidatus Acidoferrales bacterium]|nr:ribosome small subunit-dependent GTPase A [Candidatus Acidoferrales bacterium]